MNPLEWPGLVFLLLYVPYLVLGTWLALWLRRALRRPKGEPLGSGAKLDPYEVALLGHSTVLIEAALAALLHRGVLLLEGGTLRPKGPPPPEVPPYERAVYAAVGAGSESLARLRRAMKPETERMRKRLVAEGLLVNASSTFLARWLPVFLFFGLVISPGVSRLYKEGSYDGLEIALVVILMLFACMGLVAFFARPWRSQLGDATLMALKVRHQPLRTAMASEVTVKALSGTELALAVGLFGIAPLPREVFWALWDFLE